jgi:hypothetical protein
MYIHAYEEDSSSIVYLGTVEESPHKLRVLGWASPIGSG